MKTFLLLAVSSVITAGALPSLPAKIILSAFVLLAVLTQAVRRAPSAIRMRMGFTGTWLGPDFACLGHPLGKPEPKNN